MDEDRPSTAEQVHSGHPSPVTVMKRSFGEHIKAAAAYAFLATIFMAGFGVAAAIWSSSLAPMQAEQTRIREDRDRKAVELDQVKGEYVFYRGKYPPVADPPPLSATVPAKAEAVPAKLVTIETWTVSKEATKQFFNGEILVSVSGLDFDSTAGGRHYVTGTVGSPGYRSTAIERKGVGYSIQYIASRKFDVRITNTDTFSATFQVTLLNK